MALCARRKRHHSPVDSQKIHDFLDQQPPDDVDGKNASPMSISKNTPFDNPPPPLHSHLRNFLLAHPRTRAFTFCIPQKYQGTTTRRLVIDHWLRYSAAERSTCAHTTGSYKANHILWVRPLDTFQWHPTKVKTDIPSGSFVHEASEENNTQRKICEERSSWEIPQPW